MRNLILTCKTSSAIIFPILYNYTCITRHRLGTHRNKRDCVLVLFCMCIFCIIVADHSCNLVGNKYDSMVYDSTMRCVE